MSNGSRKRERNVRYQPDERPPRGVVLGCGAPQVVRGGWTPHRLVVIEFDSVEQAKAWQSAPDYADLRDRLNKVSRTDVVIVEGA